MRPEVSELNREGIGIVASGINGRAILPSFTSRRAETTVQLMDGQSFAIGGLLDALAGTHDEKNTASLRLMLRQIGSNGLGALPGAA